MEKIININNIEKLKEINLRQYLIAYDAMQYYRAVDIESEYDSNEELLTFNVYLNASFIAYRYNAPVDVEIKAKTNGDIVHYECECSSNGLCHHVISSLMLLEKDFPTILKKFEEYFIDGSNLISLFKKDSIEKSSIINMEIELELMNNYRGQALFCNIKFGINKLYVLRTHINKFYEAYINKSGQIKYGKDFIYDASTMRFNTIDDKIIDTLFHYLQHSVNYYNVKFYDNYMRIMDQYHNSCFELLYDTKKAFKLKIKNQTFNISNIKENIELPIEISNDQDKMYIELNINKMVPLTNDYSFVLLNNEVYKIGREQQELLKVFSKRKKLEISNKDVEDFEKYVIPNLLRINKKVGMPKNLEEKYNYGNPKVKLFFDIEEVGITCLIKVENNEEIYNILEPYNSKYLKDASLEEGVKNYLLDLGFELNLKNANYIIADDEGIISFIETVLPKLNEISIYECFITDKLKGSTYIKTASVKSEFSLGQDQLLSCDFEVDGISSEELISLLESLKYKKKYHRLKSGEFIDIEKSTDLNELENILDTLDIDNKQLKKGTLKIPKFKALYLSSKKDDLSIIHTDNSFDQFINNFRKAKLEKVTIAIPHNVKLRDYQITGIKWMQTIAKYGFGGILADEMGLGKTLQAIMYIKSRLKEDKTREILIVCPTSLIYNWQAEFQKFASDIKVKVIADVRQKREKIFEELKDYEVFITSYGLLREDLEKYKPVHYDTMIIDEAQAIKNVGAKITIAVKSINADIKFALTGTPIENSLVELFSIFDFIMPGYFSSIGKFQKKYGKIIYSTDKQKQEFNKLIEPFILRRKKKDVVKELPDKIEKSLVAELSDEQKKIYTLEVEKVKSQIQNSVLSNSFSQNKMVILQSLTRLRQICLSPSLYIDNYKGRNAKIDLLIDIINSSIEGGHKMLIFSQFTSALSLVIDELRKNNLDYFYLDGSTKAQRRLDLVNQFNDEEDKVKIFLISLKAGGNGLNLIGADVVVHLDPWWNPAVENQATDRAHRIGQKKVVEVIKLVAKGTIEEKIIKLQEMKKELSAQVIEGTDESDKVLMKLDEKELMNLLTNDDKFD